MGSEDNQQTHFVLFPFMAPGHMVPMIDIARLLAQHGMIVTIVTTSHNAARFKPVLGRATKSGLKIRVLELQFPSEKIGLPQGCENCDMLPSLDMLVDFLTAACELEKPVDQLFQELNPKPNCIISDMGLPWTNTIAKKWEIPRISFAGLSCLYMLCMHGAMVSKVLEAIKSDTEYFEVPGLPDNIQFTKPQIPGPMDERGGFHNLTVEAEKDSYGLIMNTFEELESAYVKEYKKAMGSKQVWCIGPVSLCNKDMLDKAERGNRASFNQQEFLNWLDSLQTGSVVYACLGSLNNLTTPQMVELGLGLEASNRPFIWVLRAGDRSKQIENWVCESGFEERTKGRGLVIRGWVPQVLILSHPAIGGFLTHCGWNSTLEAISAGLPMVTWPLFGDQFCNEKLVIQVLKTGVSIGVEVPQKLREEEQVDILVKKDDVARAVNELMEGGEEREGRRKRAKQLGEMAKGATEEGGSSYLNLKLLIKDIIQQAAKH